MKYATKIVACLVPDRIPKYMASINPNENRLNFFCAFHFLIYIFSNAFSRSAFKNPGSSNPIYNLIKLNGNGFLKLADWISAHVGKHNDSCPPQEVASKNVFRLSQNLSTAETSAALSRREINPPPCFICFCASANCLLLFRNG